MHNIIANGKFVRGSVIGRGSHGGEGGIRLVMQ